MADPERALTIRGVDLGDTYIVEDKVVWVHGRSGDSVQIEYKGHRGTIAADAIVPYPFKGPGLEAVRKLDACFGLEDEAFAVEHFSQQNYYRFLRCHAHGRLFLDDTRGGIAMYGLLTLLKEDEQGTPDEIWSRYHALSDSRLFYDGRTL